MYKELASITVPADPVAIVPLQAYIKELAIISAVDPSKLLNLDYLIEELFSGILKHALKKESENKIELKVKRGFESFVLSFHYRGLPYGYNIDNPEDDQDMFSMALIHGMSSSFSIHEDGKAGQTIEVKIAVVPSETLHGKSFIRDRMRIHAADEIVIERIKDEDMESLVQCLYYVFDYNYAADDMYNPSALRKRRADGVYEGFVARNTQGKIVAHAGLLKKSLTDKICECGQAFVMPEYGRRGLFPKLKAELIQYADQMGLFGVISSSVTGHPYTQRANLSMGCVEIGIELSYIPSDVESVIERIAGGKRQSVMNYFIPTSHKPAQTVYVPESHAGIISETYQRLGLERQIIYGEATELPDDTTIISSEINNIWNHIYLQIERAGKEDFSSRIEAKLRSASAAGCCVCYTSLPLDQSSTISVISELEKCGFFYSGIVPYELDGRDSIRMQLILRPEGIEEEEVIAESEWGKKLRGYIFKEKDK